MEKQIFDIKKLFADVQMNKILPDGKTFPDCIPNFPLPEIESKYLSEKQHENFNLKDFVFNNFSLPITQQENYKTDATQTTEEHINALWKILTRSPDNGGGSLINLPFSYIVPGGRFREIYYWDSYFTMLGLQVHGQINMIQNMVDNFAYLIQTIGHIPNGNRSYYMSRSQPPFFALMVELLAEATNDESLYIKYLDTLQKEYNFWQAGFDENTPVNIRTVKLGENEFLNRYFDTSPTPRQESYAEDIHVKNISNQPSEIIFTNLRAGAESGWDFSSRWFADFKNIKTIRTTEIIPVDLNCLLYKLEMILSKAYLVSKNILESERLKTIASNRFQAIIKYCWNDEIQFFSDYHFPSNTKINVVTAAGLMPLFVADSENIFIKEKIKTITNVVENILLKNGGIVTTSINSGQQWDAPNGWAPMQWISIKGLLNFGEEILAKTIAKRWLSLNDKVFAATGKMMEKYDVEDITKLAGGGEYESQDGFGWTNGVYLALKKMMIEDPNSTDGTDLNG